MIGRWPSPFEARPSAERLRVTDYKKPLSAHYGFA
jgi:hypothetical protein